MKNVKRIIIIACIMLVLAISGKEMGISYTVNAAENAADTLEIKLPQGRSKYVAKGKTLQLKAVLNTGNGSSVSKKVKWTSSNTTRASVSSKGLVTMKVELYNPVTITAVTTDGSNRSASITLYGTTPVKNISMGNISYLKANSKYTLQLSKSKGLTKYPLIFNEPASGNAQDICVCPDVVVTSSSPDILYAAQEGNSIVLKPLADSQKKKIKVTVKSMDGKGKTQTWYFTVIN